MAKKTINLDESIMITIEDADIDVWREFLQGFNEIYGGIHSIQDDGGFKTIQIVCAVEDYLEMLPKLIELDDGADMIGVWRTYKELQDMLGISKE